MVDVLKEGFFALEVLSRDVNVPVHIHRTMHGAFTRDKAQKYKLICAVQAGPISRDTNLHTGSYMGKMARGTLENDLSRDALRDEWFGLKRIFPVALG